MLLAQSHHFFDLGEDLSFTQDQAVETSRHPQEVIDRLVVVISKKMG